MPQSLPSPFSLRPHQAPCQLSAVLSRTLARRFGSAAVAGIQQSEWVGRAGWLPALMALVVSTGGVPASALDQVNWASYEEPNPENLPCGAFVDGEPNPTQWVWALSVLFDQTEDLEQRAWDAWCHLLLKKSGQMRWSTVHWEHNNSDSKGFTISG